MNKANEQEDHPRAGEVFILSFVVFEAVIHGIGVATTNKSLLVISPVPEVGIGGALCEHYGGNS